MSETPGRNERLLVTLGFVRAIMPSAIEGVDAIVDHKGFLKVIGLRAGGLNAWQRAWENMGESEVDLVNEDFDPKEHLHRPEDNGCIQPCDVVWI